VRAAAHPCPAPASARPGTPSTHSASVAIAQHEVGGERRDQHREQQPGL
jgi:hypothetical protein